MVCVFHSREVTDGTVSISGGWTQIVNARDAIGGLIAAWYRVYQGGDVAPTLTLANHSTGATGDSAISQIAAWRGVNQASPIRTDLGTTPERYTSQQDIGPMIMGTDLDPGEAQILIGAKVDDWTSVAVLSDGTLTWVEVGDHPNTSGSDNGLVWDYAINGTGSTFSYVSTYTFTVTGGGAVNGVSVGFKLIEGPAAEHINLLLRGVG